MVEIRRQVYAITSMKPNMGEARRGGRLWAETAYARTASMWQLLNLPDETRQRRDIGEYLAAMGQFFSRGPLARPFLVRRMYEGVLRELSLDVSLPPETQDEELVSRMLARRDPARAKRVLETLKEVNTALESRSHWTESQTVDAMRRLTGCL